MTAQSSTQPDVVARRVNRVAVITLAGLVAVFVVGIYAAFRFVETERLRELQAWQVRLGVVADSRVGAVGEWVEGNRKALRDLAENASLQLYMTELTLGGGDRSQVGDEPAQATYLRTLLTVTAERSGFAPPPAGAEVSANVERVGLAGIALTDASGATLVASPGFPPLSPKVKSAVIQATNGEPVMIDIFPGPSNLPTVGFALPVFAIQDNSTAKAIGVVVGLRLVGKDLFDRLKQPGDVTTSAETYLVRPVGETIEYLTPLADGTAPSRRTLARSTPQLADAFAIDKPGGFAILRDYLSNEVLVTSRAVAGTPWTLVRKIGRQEALADSETRLRTTLFVLIAIIAGMAVTLFAVWRHGASVRAAEAAERFRIAAERMSNLSKFMRVVTNSQPTQIIAVTGEGKYTFANEPAARAAGLSPEDMRGKSMASVIGPVRAGLFMPINKDILKEFAEHDDAERARRSQVHEFGEGEDAEVVRVDHIPLRGDRDFPPSVLMVLDDLTELTRERRRGERMLRQLIETLVSVVDRRDPFSANHSGRVAEVARIIAQEMDAPDEVVRAVDIAGNLMNLGKIFIPPDLLTKTADLSPEERKQLAGSYLVSAELLRNVEFKGPVVESIRQMGETWEGSGPLGLAGENILPSARILAVANAFVGMASARAWREAMTFDAVAKVMVKDAGSKYDRKPVSALVHVLENRGGTEKWAHFRQAPSANG